MLVGKNDVVRTADPIHASPDDLYVGLRGWGITARMTHVQKYVALKKSCQRNLVMDVDRFDHMLSLFSSSAFTDGHSVSRIL